MLTPHASPGTGYASASSPVSADAALLPPQALRPMGLRLALLFFGGPALLFIFGIWVLRPFLGSLGLSAAASTSWATGSLAAVLLLIALAAYRLEGNPWSWRAFRSRYRLHPIGAVGWLWTLGALVVMFASVLGLSPLRDQVMAQLGWSIPDVPFTSDVLGLSIMMLFVVLGEDLWWRGYVLPRQELAHGRWAWFVHGTGWALFHVATWWELPTLWPGALAISFVSQRTKNTVPAMVVHFIFDFIAVSMVAFGITT